MPKKHRRYIHKANPWPERSLGCGHSPVGHTEFLRPASQVFHPNATATTDDNGDVLDVGQEWVAIVGKGQSCSAGRLYEDSVVVEKGNAGPKSIGV